MMKNYTYEYDVVVQGEHLNINPKDLATARELARSWGGQIVQRKVTAYEPLPAEKQERKEYTVKFGDPDDEFMIVLSIHEGRSEDAPEVETWSVYFSTAKVALRNAGYVVGEPLGNRTFRAYR